MVMLIKYIIKCNIFQQMQQTYFQALFKTKPQPVIPSYACIIV